MSAAGSGLPEHEQRAWDAIVADLSGQIDLGPVQTGRAARRERVFASV